MFCVYKSDDVIPSFGQLSQSYTECRLAIISKIFKLGREREREHSKIVSKVRRQRNDRGGDGSLPLTLEGEVETRLSSRGNT